MNFGFGELTHWTWWIIGLVLVIIEVFASGTFFLWLGISAVVVGALLYFVPDVSWELQFAIFAVLSIVSVLLFKKIFQKNPKEQSTLSRRGARYIGEVVVVEEEIRNGVGRVRIEDTLWRATGPDSDSGERVKIVSVEGATLRVEKNA